MFSVLFYITSSIYFSLYMLLLLFSCLFVISMTKTKCCHKCVSSAAQEFLTHEGYFVADRSSQPAGSAVARGDVARFMLSLLNNDAWLKQAVAIITKRE